MQPIFGFSLYLAAVAVIWIIASKRGRAGWAFALGCLIAGPILARVGYSASQSSVGAAFTAFLAPALAFVVALSAPSSEQKAVEEGAHGGFRKCPFCAEAIRIEAVKCKHCASDLSPATAQPNTAA